MNLLVLIGLAIIFLIIYIYYKKIVTEEETDVEINNILNDKLHGEEFSKDVVHALNLINSKNKKSAIDYYNLGTLQFCNVDDIINAQKNYLNALHNISKGDIKLNEAVVMLYKMENILNRTNKYLRNGVLNSNPLTIGKNNELLYHIKTLQHKIYKRRLLLTHIDKCNRIITARQNQNNQNANNQNANNQNANNQNANNQNINNQNINNQNINNQNINNQNINNQNANNRNRSKHIKSNHVHQKISKQFENRKKWSSDAQNVHDSSILTDMRSQFNYIKNYNDEQKIPMYNFAHIKNEMIKLANNDPRMKSVMDRLRDNSKVLDIKGVGEMDLLIEVYRRINSPINIKNRDDLMDSLKTCLLDCTSNGSLVCPTGRQTRIMGALAILDTESEDIGIGILKNKEAIRNEIFDESSKIVNKYVGEYSTVPQNIINDYIQGIQTRDVTNLEQQMQNDIAKLYDKFKNRLDDIALKQIIDECMEVI